jgi:drug/metabolite transporter (DMT)-like permease
LAGGAVLVVTSDFQRALDLIDLDVTWLASISCIGNALYVSPNIATIINSESSLWYQPLNTALTGVSLAKGTAAIPLATSTNPVVKKMFPAVETIINVIWNVPVVANIVVNKSVWDTTYKSLIPGMIGNFAFNIGGIMELPIALDKEPVSQEGLATIQAALMLGYAVCMITAGGIYAWDANQEH